MIRALPLADEGDLWEGLTISAVARHPAYAHVAARVPQRLAAHGLSLQGHVDGPFCAHSRTLRARFPMRHDADDPLSASAGLVDPCFWSSELPFLYQVDLELRQGDSLVAKTCREIGIRPIQVSRGAVLLAGAPIVFRAVDPRAVRGSPPLEAWRDTATAMLAASPDENLCASCSRMGVMLLADCRASSQAVDLGFLAKYPAVMAVIGPRGKDLSSGWGAGGPLRAVDSHEPGLEPQRASELWHVDFDEVAVSAWEAFRSEHTGLVSRGAARCDTLDAARRQCDRLQADAARYGQFAGYLVRARET